MGSGHVVLGGIYVTLVGPKSSGGVVPCTIGSRFVCRKEPSNPHDTEAIRVMDQGGDTVGYLANSTHTKANGTMSSARIYDKVGDSFLIEACFSTQTKIICKLVDFEF